MIKKISCAIFKWMSGLWDMVFDPTAKPVKRHEHGVDLTVSVKSHDRRLAITQLALGDLTLTVPYANIPVGNEISVHIGAFDVSLSLTSPKHISTSNIIPCKVVSINERVDGQMDIALDAGLELWACITRPALSRLDLEPGKKIFALVKAVAIDREGIGRWNVDHNLFSYGIVGDPIGEERRAKKRWIEGALEIVNQRRSIRFEEAREKGAKWLSEERDLFDLVRGDEDAGNYFKMFFSDEKLRAHLREANPSITAIDGVYDVKVPLSEQPPGGLTKEQWLEKYGAGKTNGQ
jgi:molybdopterin-binding protein